jgi:hypothetical protein
MRLALPIVWSDRHRRHDPGGALRLPTVFVGGGYDLTTIGPLVCETLAGVQEGLARA